MPSYQCPDHQVKRRLQGQKEADLRRLTITEVDERSSPESPEVRSRSRFTHSYFPNVDITYRCTTRATANIASALSFVKDFDNSLSNSSSAPQL